MLFYKQLKKNKNHSTRSTKHSAHKQDQCDKGSDRVTENICDNTFNNITVVPANDKTIRNTLQIKPTLAKEKSSVKEMQKSLLTSYLPDSEETIQVPESKKPESL